MECFLGSQRYFCATLHTICFLCNVILPETVGLPDVLMVSLSSESGSLVVVKDRDENELPGPPSKPQVTDVTKNSVSLSWQPGLPGASPISSYVIEAFRYEFCHNLDFS